MADTEQRDRDWADEDLDLQEPTIKTNSDGTKTIITYRLNEGGQKVKITQKVKEVIVKETVNKEVAKRKKWAKFGAERNTKPGPDFRTTQVGEAVQLRLGTSWKALEKEEEEKKQDESKTVGHKTIVCRTCQGAHFTSKCPYKDSFVSVDGGSASADGALPDSGLASAPGAIDSGIAGKYVPKHLRNGALPGVDNKRERDDSTTLKVTQLNEIVDEEMLRHEVFAGFGPLVRVNVVRNRETNRSKGLAFVQFTTEEQAQRALEALDGKGYHSLILRLEWSKPKK